MIVTMMPVVGRRELWLIQLTKKQSKLGKERPRKIEKTVLDWDNGTGDCVDENGIPLKKNKLNSKFLEETIGVPLFTLYKYLFSNLSKRKVIGDGVGGKYLFHKKYSDFARQVAARYDCVNNGLARREVVDLVQELNLHLERPDASRQVSRHIIPKSKQSKYIKGFVTPQSTTTYKSTITVDQQFW